MKICLIKAVFSKAKVINYRGAFLENDQIQVLEDNLCVCDNLSLFVNTGFLQKGIPV